MERSHKNIWTLINDREGQRKSIFPVTSPATTKILAAENLALIRRLKLDRELSAHEEIISSIRWDEAGRLLVSASNDGFVNVWDMNKHVRIVKNFSPGHPSGIYCAKVKPYTGAHVIITTGADRSLKYSDLLARTVHSYVFHAAGIREFVFDPDCSNVFITGGEDGTIRQIDTRLPGSSPQQGMLLVDLRRQSKRQVQLNSHLSISTYTMYRTEVTSLDINKYAPYQIVMGGTDPIVRVYDRRYLKNEEDQGCIYRFMPAEVKRMSTTFPFHKTVASVKFSHFGNQILANYSNDHIYLFDIDKNYPKYLKMKQAISKIASENAKKKESGEKKRKIRSEENSRTSRKRRKKNNGEAVDAENLEKTSEHELPTEISPSDYDSQMNVDSNGNQESNENNSDNNNTTQMRLPAGLTSLISRLTGLVARMSNYTPNTATNSNNNNTGDDSTANQDENVNVDSRDEETSLANQPTEQPSDSTNNPESSSNAAPDTESQSFQPSDSTGDDSAPPRETTITNNNLDSADRFAALMASAATARVAIDIPATRTDPSDEPQASNNSEETSDENSDTSTRLNLLGINSSINQELESCETKYAMKFTGHKNMVTLKNAEFLGAHQEYIVCGSDDGKIFIWSTSTGKIVNILECGTDNEQTRVCPRPNDLMLASTELFNKKVRLWRAVGEAGVSDTAAFEELAKKNEQQVETATRAEVRLPELFTSLTNLFAQSGGDGTNLNIAAEALQGNNNNNSNAEGEVNCCVM